MRRKSIPPRHKHIRRIFPLGWTECFGCKDEVRLERIWEYTVQACGSSGKSVCFCSICARSKEEVLHCYDVTKALKAPKPPGDE